MRKRKIARSFRVVGIYKITSPSGKVYIGQSWHIPYRRTLYKCKGAKKQPKLNASIIKYSWDAHEFEIIHELPYDTVQRILDDYEQLYIDLYKNCGITLLNIREGGSRGLHKQESIEKISKAHIGKSKGRIPWNKGRTNVYSEETINKIKAARARQLSSPRSAESREKSRKSAIMRGISKETRNKMMEAKKIKLYNKGHNEINNYKDHDNLL